MKQQITALITLLSLVYIQSSFAQVNRLVFNVSSNIIGIIEDTDGDEQYDQYVRIQMERNIDLKQFNKEELQSIRLYDGYFSINGKDFFVDNEKYRKKYSNKIDQQLSQKIIGIAVMKGRFKVEDNMVFRINYVENERGESFTHIDNINEGGGSGGNNCNRCTSGGQGATACSLGSDIGPLGSSCSVDCSVGYYACCDSNVVKCFCCGNGPN